MRQGTWEPGGFPPEVTLSVKVTLMVAMMVRGVDYGTGDSVATSHRLGVVESAAPLWLWGIAFTLTACLGLSGMVLRRWQVVFWAHLLGCAGYLSVASGLALEALGRVGQPRLGEGWVIILPLLTAGVTCVVAYRTGWVHARLVAVGAVVALLLGAASMGVDGIRNSVVLLTIGVLHALLALGTAKRATQDRLRRQME